MNDSTTNKTKKCKMCQNDYEASTDNFYLRKNVKDKLDCMCKTCRKQKNKMYKNTYINNRRKIMGTEFENTMCNGYREPLKISEVTNITVKQYLWEKKNNDSSEN